MTRPGSSCGQTRRLRAAGGGPGPAACDRAPGRDRRWIGCDTDGDTGGPRGARLHVHGHRRLHPPGRGHGRRSVGHREPQPRPAHAGRRGGASGRGGQGDRRRLLLRLPEAGDAIAAAIAMQRRLAEQRGPRPMPQRCESGFTRPRPTGSAWTTRVPASIRPRGSAPPPKGEILVKRHPGRPAPRSRDS